jgi:hypothetical protein
VRYVSGNVPDGFIKQVRVKSGKLLVMMKIRTATDVFAPVVPVE